MALAVWCVGREIGPENKVPGGGFQFPAAWKTSCTHCDLSVTTSGDTGRVLYLEGVWLPIFAKGVGGES